MASMTAYFEFEVSLEGTKPRVWRRFRLRKDATFHELHDTIQKACGWQNYHLFDFHPVDSRERLATSPHDEPWDENDVAPVAEAVLIDRKTHTGIRQVRYPGFEFVVLPVFFKDQFGIGLIRLRRVIRPAQDEFDQQRTGHQ